VPYGEFPHKVLVAGGGFAGYIGNGRTRETR
jgi:hypothetical protein